MKTAKRGTTDDRMNAYVKWSEKKKCMGAKVWLAWTRSILNVVVKMRVT